jgi:hypothetical protein
MVAMNRAVLVRLFLLLALPACSALPRDAGDRRMTVAERSTFTVILSIRAGTGYAWSVDGADARTVEVI